MSPPLRLLATDLDRTLFPNGDQPVEPGAMERFTRWVEQRSFLLVYNSGRSREEILEGMQTFGAPAPDIMVGEVGTRIYRRIATGYAEDMAWQSVLQNQSPGWDADAVEACVATFAGTEKQPPHHQNTHKRSYFLSPQEDAAALSRQITEKLKSTLSDLTTVYSVDETNGDCLFDVLPTAATKRNAMEYLRKSEGLTKEEVFFSGDSGNDLEALTVGYRSLLVRNATPEVREAVRQRAAAEKTLETLYVAEGHPATGNGYYVSGILEGLAHFGWYAPTDPNGHPRA